MRWLLVGMIVLLGAATRASDQPHPFSPPPRGATPGVNPIEDSSCGKMRFADFSQLDDAIAQVTLAVTVKATATVPEHCLIEGYAWRNNKFRLRVPLAGWNGKLLVTGPGGQGGDLPLEYWTQLLGSPDPLKRGFALASYDGGHFSSGTDSKWAFNNEVAIIDLGFRSAHVTNVVAKAILQAYQGRSPAKTYYHSCSGGGRMALMMAQRYPWDFDGIVAGAPSMDTTGILINRFWRETLLKDQSREGFDKLAAAALHKGVLAQCDTLDGKADGILDDPRRCRVDLGKIMCKAGRAEDCLTPRQADIARKIYEGPRDADGKQIVRANIMPGSELGWVGAGYASPTDYSLEMFRYLAFDPAPGPGWQPDPAKLGDYARRMGLMESLMSPTNPDLRRYRDQGGKLIVYHGWNDLSAANDTVDYYETVERVMGGRDRTADFFQLYMIPGMSHCTGGEGVFAFDFLGAIDGWVSSGQAPDGLTGFHPNEDGTPKFSRTIEPYRSEP